VRTNAIRRIALGAVVVAMGTTLRFPLNVIQIVAGLFLFALGILTWKKNL